MKMHRSLHRSVVFAMIVCVFRGTSNLSHTSAKDVYFLGFLSPFPAPKGDSLIPMQLAQQWQSAFRVALEVLNSEDRTYQLEAVLADTSCSWKKVSSLAHVLNQRDLIGIVGPACSGAALSATQYFAQDIPIISFAATHDLLSNRNSYPNFFRTVYGDSHQARAMLSVLERLDVWNATIICATDYYSLSLASSIQQLATQRVVSMKVLDVAENTSVQASQVKEILGGLDAGSVFILVLPPSVARDFWTVAMDLGKTTYPWWYLGTDGVTSLDPSIDGSSELSWAVQGQVGLAPKGGDVTKASECKRFFDHWKAKAYPGLPSADLDSPRAYVAHLIDAVVLYFEIVDALVKRNARVNASTVLSALQCSGPGSPNFKGCTGNVEIDPETGSRRVSTHNPAVYDFVSWMNTSWKLNGSVHDATFISLQPLMRPLVTSLPGEFHSRTAMRSGLIGGGFLLAVGLVVLATILVSYLLKRSSQMRGFARIIN